MSSTACAAASIHTPPTTAAPPAARASTPPCIAPAKETPRRGKSQREATSWRRSVPPPTTLDMMPRTAVMRSRSKEACRPSLNCSSISVPASVIPTRETAMSRRSGSDPIVRNPRAAPRTKPRTAPFPTSAVSSTGFPGSGTVQRRGRAAASSAAPTRRRLGVPSATASAGTDPPPTIAPTRGAEAEERRQTLHLSACEKVSDEVPGMGQANHLYSRHYQIDSQGHA